METKHYVIIKVIDQIMQQLRYIFDGQTAKEVLEAYLA